MTTRDATAPTLPWDAANPYPYYERRRDEGDVVWDAAAGAWLILGYHAAQEVLGGPGWTSDPLAAPSRPQSLRVLDPDLLRRNMLTTDGASHQGLRGSVRDVFTRSFISGLGEGVHAIAGETIDSMPAGVEFDFMAHIALPLPIAVAAAWLGLGVESARLLREESPAISRMLSDFGNPAAVDAGTAALATLLTEFLPLAADRRTNPTDDLLSFIAGSSDLELDDVVTTAIVIAIAGHETTANLLGASMIRLLSSQDNGRPVDHLDAVDDRVVTELLRLDAPVQAVGRTALCDHTVDDVAIGAGEWVLVVVAAANRDPAVFAEPEQFQPQRPGPAPLAFGYGTHFCLGAALARLEIVAALQHLLARRPVLTGDAVWRDTPAIRGPHEVPIVFTGP